MTSIRKEYAYYFDAPEKISHNISGQKTMQRSESIGVLEKYSKVIQKENEVIEKQVKTKRLREQLHISFPIHRAQRKTVNDLPTPTFNRSMSPSQTPTLNRSMSPSQMRRNILKSRNELLTRTWGPMEMEKQLELIEPSMEPIPRDTKKNRPVREIVSVTLHTRRAAAEKKNEERRTKIESLEEDCFQAQLLIDKIKDTSYSVS